MPILTSIWMTESDRRRDQVKVKPRTIIVELTEVEARAVVNALGRVIGSGETVKAEGSPD